MPIPSSDDILSVPPSASLKSLQHLRPNPIPDLVIVEDYFLIAVPILNILLIKELLIPHPESSMTVSNMPQLGHLDKRLSF